MLSKNQKSSCPQMGHVEQYRKQYSTVQWGMARQRTSVGFKPVVRTSDIGACGLVVPLLCTTYFGKLPYCLAVPCHCKHRPSSFVFVSQPSLT